MNGLEINAKINIQNLLVSCIEVTILMENA